jgi:hypothetical protein
VMERNVMADSGRGGGLRHIGDIVGVVLEEVCLRRGDALERLPNHPRMEWMFSCVEGMEPSRQKTLILQARSPEVAFLEDVEVDIMLDALGIKAA